MRGRGLGRRMLAWQEGRGAELHRERHPDVPGVLQVGVYDTAPTRAALVRAAGYAEVRYFNDMERDLTGELPPVPPVPAGLRVVPFDPRYDDATRLAHTEAFADHWGSTPTDPERWKHWYTGAQSFRPAVSLLLLDGDEVAAYLLSYFWAADAEATGVREALGRPARHPAGVAAARAGLAAARHRPARIPGRRLPAGRPRRRQRQLDRRARPVRAARLHRGASLDHLVQVAGGMIRAGRRVRLGGQHHRG